MKILLGALTLLAATSTWANGCATDPSYGYGCGGGYGNFAGDAAAPVYGTSTRIITGHDGTRHIETAPSYTPHDEVRVIDYSTPYISDRVIELENKFQRFELD